MFRRSSADPGVAAPCMKFGRKDRADRALQAVLFNRAANLPIPLRFRLEKWNFNAVETGPLKCFEQRNLFSSEVVGPDECVSAEFHVYLRPWSDFQKEISPSFLLSQNPDRRRRPDLLRESASRRPFACC